MFPRLLFALLALSTFACSSEDEGGRASGGGGAGTSGGSGGVATGGAGTGGFAGAPAGGGGGSAGTSAGGGSGSGGTGASPDMLPPYAPDFAINVPIPAGVASDARSAKIVARLKANLTANKVQLSNHGEVPTVYTVKPSDPEYTVDASYLNGPIDFRVPAGAVEGEGSDHPLILLDPTHPQYGQYTELRVWQATVDHAKKSVTGNGAGLFHYNNDGALLNPDKSPSHSNPFEGAGTGSGLSYLAGLVRPAEVTGGKILHAIRFAYSNCDSSNQFRAPATKTDQPKNCTSTPAPAEERMDMGMRLELDPTLDCNTRTVPGKADTSNETRFLRIFCRALQEYGMIMLDGTGPGGLVIYMENEATAGFNQSVGAELYGSYSYLIRDQDSPSDGLTRGPTDGIPWEKLRVLAQSSF